MGASVLASLCLNLAYSMFAIFIAIVLLDSLPLRLLDPDWILTTASTIVNAVTIPLLGLGLVHLAAHFCPTPRFTAIQARLSRFAVLTSIGFLLLLPLLGLLTFRNGINIERSNQAQKVQLARKTTQIREAIAAANTSKELQEAMVALQGPQIDPSVLNQPLPELKQQVLRVVNQAQASFVSQLRGPYSKEYIPVLKQVLRIGALSFVSGLAFASLAWIPAKNATFLGATLGSFKGSLLSPDGLLRSWKRFSTAVKAKIQVNASAESLRKKREERARVLKQERTQREQKIKFIEADRRKQRERMERERQKRVKHDLQQKNRNDST